MINKLNKYVTNPRLKRRALIKKQNNALHALPKDEAKLYIFSTQFSRLIDAIPDATLLKTRAGRKLVTHKLTLRLFKQHDINWYGKTTLTTTSKNQQTPDPEHDQISLQAELNLALEKHQLKLYYQALVNSAGNIVGAEALLRWEHPHYGLIAPDQFLLIAEQSGLILPISTWVLQSVCEQLTLWQNDPLKQHLLLAVNISPRQFNQPEFVITLRKILKHTGINAARLKLELTESLLLHDTPNTIKKMQALKLLGIRFSMDNFGTGSSSFSQLKQLPLDQLKIDKFLIRDIVLDSCNTRTMKAVIDMSNKLGINLVAAGVENEQQFTSLKHLGCYTYQGYLFGKPMPLAEFEKLLSKTPFVSSW